MLPIGRLTGGSRMSAPMSASLIGHSWHVRKVWRRSVLPGARYPTKDVAVDRHMADGRERQVSGHQRLAVRRQLPHETYPDAGRLLGVVLEAVVPIRVFEPDRKHGVAGKRQPVAAGRQTDHAVPGGVAAGTCDAHPWRHLVIL